jgi:outer membrane protein assembly factor BamB
VKPCLLCLATLAVLHPAVRAGDWPGWRGPTGLGFTDDKALPLRWDGKTGQNVLWKVALPGTEAKADFDFNQSSPIVWGDRVFVTTVSWPPGVTRKEFPEHHVTCYRAGDGKQLWDTPVPHGPWLLNDFRGGGYGAPTPATDGERVYVLFGSAVFAALDLDGHIVWRKEINPHAFDVCLSTSPVVYRDTVLLLCDQADPKRSRLAAFDCKTGAIKWERKRPDASFSHSTPVLVEVKGRPQLLVSASGALQGIDPADGTVLWSCRNPGDVPSPAYGAGLVFCDSGRGGPAVAVDPTGTGDVTKTHLKWTAGRVPDGTFSSPIIVGEHVYQLLGTGVLKCWKAADGTLLHEERLEGVTDAPSPVATADGRLYFASAGRSYVLRAGGKPEVLAVNDLGDRCRASPAVSNGRLFLKGQHFLFAIGNK